MAVDNYVLWQSTSLVIDAIGSINDNTVLQEADAGRERRIKREKFPRRRWTVSWAADEVETVETLYEVNGRHTGFLILPPRDRDYIATGMTIGTGDGSTIGFQLQVVRSTGVRTASKDILHPISGSLSITVGGSAVTEGSDYTVDYNTGYITFTFAPASSAAIVASFEYYTAVRWDSDALNTTITNVSDQNNKIQQIRSATLIELIDE